MLAEGKTVVPADGMGAISAQLGDRAVNAGVDLVTGTPVERVEPEDGSVSVRVPGETVEADAVVVAADPRSSRDLTGVEAIPTEARGCVTQQFAVPAGHPLGASDRIHLNAAGEVPNTVAPMSGVAPDYAPDDRELVAATTVGRRDESDSDLEMQTRETLANWYPAASLREFELLRTDRIDFAQFAQPPGVHQRLPDTRDPEGSVYLAGDFTHGSSIHGALDSGRVAARAGPGGPTVAPGGQRARGT